VGTGRPLNEGEWIMRILVIVLALVGLLISGFIAMVWWSAANDPTGTIQLTMKIPNPPPELVARYNAMVTTIYLLFGNAALCVVGSIVAFLRKGQIAGLVLLLAGGLSLVGAVMIHSEAKMVAAFTGLLPLIAGGLAFLIKPAKADLASEPAPGQTIPSRA
jgi:hypothetical protein